MPDNEYVITIDMDWAPDFVIDFVAGILMENKVKATWFVTHQSKAVDRLRAAGHLFELGVHPNMLPGSTHGETEDEVLAHIKNIIPEAVSMRTHGLYQTSNFLMKAHKEFGLAIDVSLFLPRASHLRPHRLKWNGASLWRIPYFWEDDSEMFEKDPIWRISDKRINFAGLKVFDFHPVHLALNTDHIEKYAELKQTLPMDRWDRDFVDAHAQDGPGPRKMFLELVHEMAGRGKQIKELISETAET